MQSLLLFLAILLITSLLYANPKGDENFRVSGIMRLGGTDFQGLIEFPSGIKSIVAEGDTIGSWKVAHISEHCIALKKATNRTEKCLAGSSDIQQPPTESPNNNFTSSSDAENNKVDLVADSMSHFKKVDKTDLLQALDSHSAMLESVTMTQLSEAILPLVQSEAGYRITEIDAQQPETGQHAIKIIRRAIDQSQPIRLTIKSDAGQENVIYLQTTQ